MILAVLLGVTAGGFVSGYWLADLLPAASAQLLVITGLLAAAAAAGHYWLLGTIARGLGKLPFMRRAWVVLLGLALAVFLFFAGTSQWRWPDRYIPFFLPRHEFRLSAAGAPEGTALVWLNTSLGDVSYDSLVSRGWIRRQDEMVLQAPVANSIEWSGVTGARVEVVVESRRPAGQVRIAWDGREESVPLKNRRTSYEHSFTIPFFASRTLVILLGLLNFLVVSTALAMAGTGRFPATVRGISNAAEGGTGPLARLDVMAIAAAMMLALLLRAFNLDGVFPAVDEYYHLIAAKQIVAGAPLVAVYQRGLWVVTLPVALALRLFGQEIWAARAVGVLFNVLAILPLYLITRKISRPVAIISCALYATSPWIITFARVAREYAYYPFYFYWIVWAMLSLMEAIPEGFVVGRNWSSLLRPRPIMLAALLVLPPVFALRIDWLSTFRTILIAYLVLGAFVLLRFDWKARANWPYLAALTVTLILGGRAWYQEQVSKLLPIPSVNPIPLEYFFPNPQQQWYFERMSVLAALAVVLAIAASLQLHRSNLVSLFMVSLFGSYLAVFTLLSKSFFHTRHLLSTEFWYVVVAGMGLHWLWALLTGAIPWSNRAKGFGLGVILGVAVLNPFQIVLPSMSTDADMPISEDYLHDMSQVQAYLLRRVQPGEVLVSTVYGLYAAWEGKPSFAASYRITSQSPKADIEAFVHQHSSGWIVMDQIRLDLSSLSLREITEIPQMEYIGFFGDEHVWRWERPSK